MTDTTNARIRTLATGITAEMIAEQTHMFYDPATGGGYVSFQAREVLYVNGTHQAPMGDFDILQVQIADIATHAFGAGKVDPVTGADLSSVSVAGVMTIIKAAYDALYNARAVAAAAAANPPAPPAAPAPAPAP
ncbi:MAG TPA: hypothetical protein VGV14_12065 [Rhodanobacter sp.]|nr:hypothetical protein [Rhodanobacter sp.]